MSDSKQTKSNVVDLESFRHRAGAAGGSADEHVWERTVQPLLPGSGGAEQPDVQIQIVKVSSGFGRLHVPAWQDTVRSMAA